MRKYISKRTNRQGAAFITVIVMIFITISTIRMGSLNHLKRAKKTDQDIVNSQLKLVESYAFEHYITQNKFPGIISEKVNYDNALNTSNLDKIEEYNIFFLDNIDKKLNLRNGHYYIVVKDNIIMNVLYKKTQ